MKAKKLNLLAAIAVLLTLATLRSLGDDVPRPEHPRPDAFRENWMTLNGEWQFEIDQQGDGAKRGLTAGHDLDSKIIVPFCPESKLSGVGHYDLMKNVWYRRMFELPARMQNKRVLVHFGGVDYQTWVWLNGQLVGSHIGGNAAFAFDLTPFLRAGQNELVVRAFDDTASGKQPTGKQTHTVSEGCVYTRTTGIWQPVWLEAVGSSFVESFSVVSDPDQSRVLIEATINGTDTNLTLTAEAFADGKSVGKESCPASWRDNRLVVNLKKKKLWMPGNPFLYDLKFTLTRKGEKIDEVASYFGLRSVSIQGRAILINGQRIFQRTILDQGFYPDGIWTAPTDAALKQDIEMSLAAGFNGARLHQKVFEPRYLYWADKLGYLVWGEFPSWGFDPEAGGTGNYINEWIEVLQRDRNHPAIIGWCPFNEEGQNLVEIQKIVWNTTKAIDPTRPVLETSGWPHTLPNAEVRDAHDYDQSPASLKSHWLNFFAAHPSLKLPARYGEDRTAREIGVPFMVSEFGGIGWATAGGWGYGNGPKTEEEFYARYEGLVNALLDNPDMFGFCYTQLTDVEQEHNGLYYYDRRPKFDLKRLHAITARAAAYEKTGPVTPVPSLSAISHRWQVLVGAALDGTLAKPFHYTNQAPPADWSSATFDDSQWPEALAPFGNPNGVRTAWKSDDIWLRRHFDWNGGNLNSAALVIHFDDDTEVLVNGQKIWSHAGANGSYEIFDISEALKKAVKKGPNIVAVHTHQTGGDQFIDLALLAE